VAAAATSGDFPARAPSDGVAAAAAALHPTQKRSMNTGRSGRLHCRLVGGGTAVAIWRSVRDCRRKRV